MNKNALLTALGILVLGGAMIYTGAYKNLTASLISQPADTYIIETNKGDIMVELNYEKAPLASENFAQLANASKYDGTIFHRVIEDFMIQGGDYQNFNGTGGESFKGGYFEDEISELSHERGALSMANKGPDTNGSQFFIVHGDSLSWLDGKHTVFGLVTEGMDVVDTIAESAVDFKDQPVEDIQIISVRAK